MRFLWPPNIHVMFSDLTADELKTIYRNIDVSVCKGKVKVNSDILDLVYRLNIDVSKIDEDFYISGNCASVFINNILKFKTSEKYIEAISGLDLINILSDYEVRPKVTYRIGARMGKPEGAKLREMKPPIHCLFPLGLNIGNQRRITDGASQDNFVEVRCQN